MGVDMRTASSFDAYETPQWLVKEITRYFGGSIDLDPCTSERNSTGAEFTFTGACEEDNGLTYPWRLNSISNVYVNSPYGRQLPAWVDKCAVESAAGLEILQLLPARFGSGWFKHMAANANALGVFNKRLSFTIDGKPVTDKNGKPCTAQFDTCLVQWGGDPDRFKDWFGKHLTYWRIG